MWMRMRRGRLVGRWFAWSEFNYLKLPFVYYFSQHQQQRQRQQTTTAATLITNQPATLTMDSSQDHACLPRLHASQPASQPAS